MAVVNTKSTIILNRDAFPPVLSSGYQAGGGDTISVATVTSTATDGIGSTYRFGFVPSGARIQDIEIQNDSTTAGVWQLGVYLNDQQSLNLGSGPAPLVPTWSATTAYVPGNLVLYTPTGLTGPLVYYCNTGNTNNIPGSGDWTAGGTLPVPAGSVPFPNANVIFNAGISTASASYGWTSVYKPSLGAVGVAASNVNLRVWELLGLLQDPNYEFHLVLTATTAPTSVGSISLQWSWVR
jgi:hypothetical protein